MKITTAKRICKKLSCQYGIVNPPDVIPLKYSHTGKRFHILAEMLGIPEEARSATKKRED